MLLLLPRTAWPPCSAVQRARPHAAIHAQMVAYTSQIWSYGDQRYMPKRKKRCVAHAMQDSPATGSNPFFQEQPIPPVPQQQQGPQAAPPPAAAAAAAAAQGTPPQSGPIPPPVAAQMLKAAAAAGRTAANVQLQDVAVVTCAWLPYLPRTLGECNKLLSQRMKLVLTGDPVAFDLIKQDGRDFMTGALDAAEFADRFFSIFAATNQQTVDELFLQMVLLLPTPQRRLELLKLARNPWVLPAGPLMPSSAAQHQQQQQQQRVTAAAAPDAPAAGKQPVATASQEAKEFEEDEYEDEDEFEDEFEDEDEYEVDSEVEEFEEEGEEPAAPQADPMNEKDLREFKGWASLDRSRVLQLASSVSVPSSEQLSAAAAARRPKSRKSALAGLRLDDGVHVNSSDARPAKKSAGKKAAKGPAVSQGSGDTSLGANAIMWFRQDLRVHDNPALCEAAKWAARHGGTVTFVYVHAPNEDGDAVGSESGCSWRPGGASLLWAAAALQSLSADLVARYGAGAAILFKQGPYATTLQEVATAVGASAVFFNRRYEPAMAATDAAVADALAAVGLRVASSNGLLLQEPWEVQLDLSKFYGHFGTLTPFYRAWSTAKPPPTPLPEPKHVPVAKKDQAAQLGGVPLANLGLYKPPRRRKSAAVAAAATELHNTQQQQQQQQRSSASSNAPSSSSNSSDGSGEIIDWGASIRDSWDISERGALSLLTTFLTSSTGLAAYEVARSYADGRSVSRLSPYLHWGQLSARLMWQRMKIAKAQALSKTFHRRLVWRDLAYWQLYYWPNLPARPVRALYSNVAWRSGAQAAADLAAWQQGRTGFPLVDAGMRELWSTGWMQQSVRMVCAAFLTEYLHISWAEGAAWFHDTLVDADLAINSMMWQNAGKSGLDQWNFTLLPTSKSQDPTGAYIKRWLPELAQLPPAYIHTPWEAPADVLQAAGVTLGETYPHRITTEDLLELRAVNVRAIRAARAPAVEQGLADNRGYDLIEVPEGTTLKHDGTKAVLFTKQEYRQPVDAPVTATGRSTAAAGGGDVVDEGEEMDAGEMMSDWQKKKQQKKAAVQSSSGGGPKWVGRRGQGQKQKGRAAARR